MADGPVVWVTQIPMRRDFETGDLTPSVNIGPATEHGRIEVLNPSSASIYASADTVRLLREKLKAYDFERGDSILGLGDPVMLAICGAILARYTSNFRVLKWERRITRYAVVEIAL